MSEGFDEQLTVQLPSVLVLFSRVLCAGAVHRGEADRVPAQSDRGQTFTLLPAPPQRELQSAVEGQAGGRLLQRQTQRWEDE